MVYPAHVTDLSPAARWWYLAGVAVVVAAGFYGARRCRARAADDGATEDRPASPR